MSGSILGGQALHGPISPLWFYEGHCSVGQSVGPPTQGRLLKASQKALKGGPVLPWQHLKNGLAVVRDGQKQRRGFMKGFC